jgi:DNA-directed RNA polymerase specialized sigma24 family protein
MEADWTELWARFHAVAAAGEAEWPALLVALEPVLESLASRQPIGRLRDTEDSPREIVTRVLGRLHASEFNAIRKLCALTPPPELRAWLRVLVRRSAIDFMRESPEYLRGGTDRPARWISLASLSSGTSAPAPDSIAEKRRLLLKYVRELVERATSEYREYGDHAYGRLALVWKVERIHVRRMVAKGEQFLRVLENVLEGFSYPETAERLGLTRREVELSVRYLEALLRERGFAGEFQTRDA